MTMASAATMRRIVFGIWSRRSRGQFPKGNCGVCKETLTVWKQDSDLFFEQLRAEGFVDEDVRANGGGLRANGGIARNHDDWNVNVLLPEDTDEIRARHGAHSVVRDEKVGAGFEDVRERIFGVGKHG